MRFPIHHDAPMIPPGEGGIQIKEPVAAGGWKAVWGAKEDAPGITGNLS